MREDLDDAREAYKGRDVGDRRPLRCKGGILRKDLKERRKGKRYE